MTCRLRVVVLSLAVGALCGLARADTSGDAVTAKLNTVLPKSWAVVRRNAGVLPEGHYWGQEYSGVRGEEILLQGVADVHVAWRDASGEWHSEAVGKEALKLYVMPHGYRESLLRFFILKRPMTARLLVETQSFRVYAHPSFRIIDNEKLDSIVKQGKATRWPDSPENTGALSWGTWSSDIPKLLQGG